VLHAARWKYGTQKSPFWHHRTTLSGYVFGTKACIDNREKNLLNSNTSSTCPDNIVNFGLPMAEICWQVWRTPANFNGFHILAALLRSTLVVGVSQTEALNRERHLYSAGWPSRWALAHIQVYFDFIALFFSCKQQLYLQSGSFNKRYQSTEGNTRQRPATGGLA